MEIQWVIRLYHRQSRRNRPQLWPGTWGRYPLLSNKPVKKPCQTSEMGRERDMRLRFRNQDLYSIQYSTSGSNRSLAITRPAGPRGLTQDIRVTGLLRRA